MLLKGDIQEIVKGRVKSDEPMARHTSLGIGGPADYFLILENVDELRKLILFSRRKRVSLKMMGQGTNLLVKDGGIRGIVARLGRGFTGVKFEDDCLLVGAANRLSTLIKLATSRGLGGLEFAIGIPGTLGGAIVTNAGAANTSLAQRLKNIRVITREGKIKSLKADDLKFGYRRCPLDKNDIILDARLKLEKVPEKEILRRMHILLERRKSTQPWGTANAGCIFKNPKPHTSAGFLIEKAGLKGKRIGGASVSSAHANFILNLKKAKAEDVLTLMKMIKAQVKKKTGISLEPEIEVWGANRRE